MLTQTQFSVHCHFTRIRPYNINVVINVYSPSIAQKFCRVMPPRLRPPPQCPSVLGTLVKLFVRSFITKRHIESR